MMELTPFSKGLWTGDNKFLHHHFTDILTSVHITREIPEDAVFGPCILQNTFYDTIAFIALKSSDRRSVPYVFRVDATALNSSTDGLSWLRLVQAANNTKEQNLEAYLKSGQLYYRSTRRIRKDEELFVWYDSELSTLLGFTDIKTRTGSNTFRCTDCDQELKYENPYLAHVRFLCGKRKDYLWRDFQALGFGHSGLFKDPTKSTEVKDKSRVTNFHRIAHDLEHSKKKSAAQDEGRPSSEKHPNKRKQDSAEESKSRKTVLLEKTNNLVCVQGGISKDDPSVIPALAVSVWKLNSDKYLLKKDSSEHKTSAFTEVRRPREKAKAEKPDGSAKDDTPDLSRKVGARTDVILSSSGSAFSSVLPSGVREEQKSAFCQPSRRTGEGPPMLLAHALHAAAEGAGDLSDSIATSHLLGPSNLLGSKSITTDLGNSHILHASVTTNSPLLYSTDMWPKPVGMQLQSTSSLTLLPPSYTSFGVSAQNWCAKCNASFRMTSDLVFHMRSHHKKEYATDYLNKRRREEKLTCPICNEFFRERHHLSRHMTSHN
ncbi:PR domain zinc finger protein 8 [Pristis pectinata]|uniref:PR domain zinc finger protein 8 n=1 Tax=Pristis pectinata TaxID=685728 RepID=UPI00223DD6A1|nr:PR domain zinc finger protein 8 [Pristis pectinata]